MRLHNATVLRLLGAWLVLLSHSASLLARPLPLGIPWAHYGLGIFFALSGALVSGSAARSSGVLDFGARRLRRLLPAYLACSLGAVLVLWPLCTRLPLSEVIHPFALLRSWIGLLVHGARWNLPGTFVDHAFPSANGSVWTLPYEALLYLMLGLLWFGGLRRVRRAWILPALLWGAAVLPCLFLPGHLPSGEVRLAGFRLLHLLHFLGFFAGGWCLATLKPSRTTLSVALLTLSLLRVVLGDAPAALGLELCLMPVLVLWIGSFEILPGRSLPDWSYGFYLWGWPVQQTWIHFHPGLGVASLVLLATLGTLPLAALSWTFVERPFLRRSPARPEATIP